MSNELASPCCNAGYEEDEVSSCCEARISESGLCYECRDHTEAEGYICEECEEWFGEGTLEPKKYHCRACGHDLDKDADYCSRECHNADNTEGV
jgi:hypothetical protein